MIKRLPLFALLVLNSIIYGQNSSFSTYTYYEDDTTSLQLDLYSPQDPAPDAIMVFFVHGGGFGNGDRKHGHEFCKFMAENGIYAASISYTLYMKGRSFSCDALLTEKVRAIQMAAFQTRLASQWIIDQSQDFSIDTSKIFLSGSSAGAEAVLQAAYWNRNIQNNFPDVLSESFKYAGVISGAGALLDINMINENTKIPTLCFHGTCDPLVPYHIAPHHYCSQITSGYMMMFGGLAIHEKLTELNESSMLMSYCGEGHKHAGTPFYGPEKQTVLDFIRRTVCNEKLNIHRIFNNGEECNLGLDFYFCY